MTKLGVIPDQAASVPCSRQASVGALLCGSRTSHGISDATVKGEPVSKHELSLAHTHSPATRVSWIYTVHSDSFQHTKPPAPRW